MGYPSGFMLGRLSIALVLGALTACATSVKGGEDRVDANPINFAIDAAPGVVADARPGAPDAMDSPITATVTGDCLFLRVGAGTENDKVVCTDSGAWCNVANDVCIPMGDSVTVTGSGLAGIGCDADWYPVEYRTYSGFSCGSFLDFSSSAASFLPTDHETLFPAVAEGPQG